MNTDARQTLRRRILTARDHLSPSALADRSLAITSRVLALPEVARATVVFVYMHFRGEVRTDGLIREFLARGATLCVPLTVVSQSRLLAVQITDPDRDLLPGYCGIPEPRPELRTGSIVQPGEIAAAIVPGSVFDPQGGRLGYGGGYYDRFLAQAAPQAARIGLAFGLQLVDQVPIESHDQAMDFVVTEDNVYDCRRMRHAQDSGLSR